MSADALKTPPKKKKYSPARYIGTPNIQKIQTAFLAILKREAEKLLDESHKGKLSAESAKNLVSYLKLIKELEKPDPAKPPNSAQEDDPDEGSGDALMDLSIEQLKKLAKKGEQNV